MSIHVG